VTAVRRRWSVGAGALCIQTGRKSNTASAMVCVGACGHPRSPAVVAVVALVLHALGVASTQAPPQAPACAAAAAAACGSSTPSALAAFFQLPSGDAYGVALCDGATAVACASTPVSAFFLPQGGVNGTAAPTAVSVGYSSVSGSVGTAQLPSPADGALLKVTDTYSAAGPAVAATFGANAGAGLTLVRVDREVVVAAGGTAAGFCSRLSLSVLPLGAGPHANGSTAALGDLLWYAPGLLYGNGSFTPPWAIGGGAADRAAASAVVFREDRLSAPVAALVDAVQGRVAAVLRPAPADGGGTPDTVLNDTLWGGAVVDARMAFLGLGFETGEVRVVVVFCMSCAARVSHPPINPTPTPAVSRCACDSE
jgi:hypothetical protein